MEDKAVKGFDALIEAFSILRKYGNREYPTHCEHDIMYVFPKSFDISEEDISRLGELGFHYDDNHEIGGECFYSYLFGSC